MMLPNNFVKLSNCLGISVVALEKEIGFLLRKLDSKKMHGVKVSGGKRKPLASFRFEREI